MCAVNVSCGGPELQMKICYDPHDGVNLTNGWDMYTKGNSKDPDCVAMRVEPDSNETQWCESGLYALTLNMNAAGGNGMCGTQLQPTVRNHHCCGDMLFLLSRKVKY